MEIHHDPQGRPYTTTPEGVTRWLTPQETAQYGATASGAAPGASSLDRDVINPQGTPQQPAKRSKKALLGVGVVAFIIGAAVGNGTAHGGNSDTIADASNPTQTVTVAAPGPARTTVSVAVTETVTAPGPAKTVTVKAAPPKPKATIPGDGVFLVGSEIKAGRYKTSGGENCYWARLKNTNGDIDSILANGNPTGPAIVTIKAADEAFQTQGCDDWQKL